MRFGRLRMSSRSQNLLAIVKGKTGITPNVSGRFALCLSLKDPSPPNPDEYDEKGSEILPSVLFGEYEDMYMALMVMRLRRDGLDPEIYLNRMLRAHFNRGAIMLHARIRNLDDFYGMVSVERGGA
ncbi:MAG: DndE family protein [Nitrosopumilaceae archaeon]|nr:DndE family protein [Nitrosopumilaceae archaeon]